MTEPLYFQWQNEVLLETIYPLRKMKLGDFLVYCREVELWAELSPQVVAGIENMRHLRIFHSKLG